jgi:PadR family transcriptional regulator PadR
MKIENSIAQMRKGFLEYCVLTLLNKQEAYPSEIINELKNAQLIVAEGTLYPLLTRLKKSNLLSYRWEESPSGPPRKYYVITEEGKTFLTQLDDSWEQLKSVINSLK